ncbi:uncharacterized protein GBIM_20514, partial [Gryllus bimaculatus]
IFGELAWQTERQIEQQIQVNLWGPLRVTHALCGLLREHAARVVTVSSHCALEALPGLAPYAATKAALEAWSAALRVEQARHGVRVVTLVPGSFSTSSNIMARHEEHAREMERQLRRERPRDWAYYEDHFRAFHRYLQALAGDKGVAEIRDPRLYFKYECCLLALWPKQQYVNAPVRYNVYHTAMRLAPRCVRDRLVTAFVHLPAFQGKAA